MRQCVHCIHSTAIRESIPQSNVYGTGLHLRPRPVLWSTAMRGTSHARAATLVVAVACAFPPGAAAGTDTARPGLCSALAADAGGTARLAVISAFPAELAPFVAAAVVHERVEADGRAFYLGELAGVRVVLGMTGIGMLNAAATAETVLTRFEVAGVVMSGVAGSPYNIGDVTVPARWFASDTGAAFTVNPALYALARAVRGRRVPLERCGPVPPPDGSMLCLPHRPRVRVGRLGRSGDSGVPIACLPGAGEIFGCELPEPAAKAGRREPVAVDMESAAVARAAAAHGVPFLAFRAVSDGAGDPLGLPGFPAQFLAYYRIAAANAAAGTVGLLERLARLGDGGRAARRACRLLARGEWKRAARVLRARGPRV